MKISAIRSVNFTNSSQPVQNRQNSSAAYRMSSPEQKHQDTSSKIYKTTAFALSGLSLAGAGIYLVHRRNINNVRKIFTALPDTPLAKSLPKDIQKELSYNNKYEKFLKFLDSPREENITGTGANSVVYNIPELDNYVLKVLHPRKNIEPNQIPLNIFPENINLGQPVWIHPDNFRLLILKKVSGEPHSIKNWSSTIWNTEINWAVPVTKEQANVYYNKVIQISDMKQSAFNDLALQIKTLDVTPKNKHDTIIGFKIDSVNPNNLMVDLEKNRLNVIDYFAKTKPQHQNSYLDMVAVISDFTLFREYYDLLSPQQQEKLLHALKTIDKKSYAAALKVNLDTNEQKFIDFINYTNKYFHVPNVPKPNKKEEYIRQYSVSAQYVIELLKSLRKDTNI